MAHASSIEVSQGAQLRFRDHRNKLFAREGLNVLFFNFLQSQNSSINNVLMQKIQDTAELQKRLDEISISKSNDTIFVVLQDYSWGRLCITEATFQILIDSLRISSRFLEIVTAFGVKSSDDERQIYSYRACSRSSQCLQRHHEICYSILYISKHGRNLKDPWSLRQLGVYHQISSDFSSSHCILLDIARHAEPYLKDFIELSTGRSRLAFHIELLLYLSSNWTEYIEYLDTELRDYNNKACYTSVDYTRDNTCDVSYPDLQELHMLETKIQRAEAAVESCLDIARGCGKHFSIHSWPSGLLPNGTEPTDLLDLYCADMECHVSSLRRLKSRLNRTLNLLSRVLVCQNGELLHVSNQASYRMLKILVDITDQSRQQQETLSTILSNGQADSALLKVFSIVATVCLPASLVATVFSSNLIQSTSLSTEALSTRLVLSTQFWIYVVITLPLMGATLTWTLYLDRRSRRTRVI